MGINIANYHMSAVTPTLDTNIYADNDRLGSIMTVTAACRFDEASSGSILQGLTLVDGDDQGVALDVLLFDELPTVASADNAAISITDAELRDKSIDVIEIANGDYVDLLSAPVVSLKNLGIICKPKHASTSIFALMVTRGGTPTYTAAGMNLKFHFDQA